MPATVATLRTYLGLDPASTHDEAAMGSAVAAANDLVAVLRPDLTGGPVPPGTVYSRVGHIHDLKFGETAPDVAQEPEPDETVTWPPRCEQAALVEAARLYGRRGSVQGIAAFADLGVTMLPRLDPEVRSLLELGEYQPSVVA